jgi:hypothetical protein
MHDEIERGRSPTVYDLRSEDENPKGLSSKRALSDGHSKLAKLDEVCTSSHFNPTLRIIIQSFLKASTSGEGIPGCGEGDRLGTPQVVSVL